MVAEAQYFRHVLPNGLTIVAERHSHVRSVAVGLWVKVGSIHESLAQNGISHFIEHMVFKGTEKRTALEIATVLEGVGGDLNAFTDRELTCFHASALSEHLELAIDAISDLVIRPKFDRHDLERERKVLLRELSASEETPDDKIYEVFFKNVWEGQPLGRSVLGTKRTVQKMARSQVEGFFKTHYRPDNMILSVAGNIDPEKLVSLCEKYFVFSNTTQAPLPLKTRSPKYHARRTFVQTAADQAHLLAGFETGGFKSEHRYTSLLLSFFLGGGMSSRLFQEIREKAALSYHVDCDYISFSDAGVVLIYCALSPRAVKPCLSIIGRELALMKEQTLPDAALGFIKGQLRGTILLSSDHMETRQESLGRNEAVFGRYCSVEEVIDEIDRVTPKMIQELAQKCFLRDKESVVLVGRSKVPAKQLSLFNGGKS